MSDAFRVVVVTSHTSDTGACYHTEHRPARDAIDAVRVAAAPPVPMGYDVVDAYVETSEVQVWRRWAP